MSLKKPGHIGIGEKLHQQGDGTVQEKRAIRHESDFCHQFIYWLFIHQLASMNCCLVTEKMKLELASFGNMCMYSLPCDWVYARERGGWIEIDEEAKSENKFVR